MSAEASADFFSAQWPSHLGMDRFFSAPHRFCVGFSALASCDHTKKGHKVGEGEMPGKWWVQRFNLHF